MNQNPIWTTLTTVPEVTCANMLLHYSGSVINLDWQCLAEQLLTDTDSAWLTVIILHWHQQLTVFICTQSQRYLTPTPDSALDTAHTVTSHHHIVTDIDSHQLPLTFINCHWQSSTAIDSHWLTLTVINWHWQSSTDTGSWQCLPAPSHILTWSWLYWEIRQTFLLSLNFLGFKHIQLIRLTVGWLKLTIHWKWSNQLWNLNKLL